MVKFTRTNDFGMYKKVSGADSNSNIISKAIGVGFIIISIGLSVAIAKSENLIFQNKDSNLSLVREALSLQKTTETIKQSTQKLKSLPNNSIIRQDLDIIEKDTKEAQDNIKKLLGDSLEDVSFEEEKNNLPSCSSPAKIK